MPFASYIHVLQLPLLPFAYVQFQEGTVTWSVTVSDAEIRQRQSAQCRLLRQTCRLDAR